MVNESPQENRPSNERLEKEIVHSLRKVLHSEMTLVDVNANKGEWLLHSSKIIKKGIIYALEPEPTNFTELKSNCHRWMRLFDNKVSMYALPIAISEKVNVARPNMAGSSASLNKAGLDINSDPYELDTLFEPINPDLIKITNANRKELTILKGARNILAKGRTKFLIEANEWPDCDGQNSLLELHNFMRSFGYYPRKIHSWTLFVNRKKFLLSRVKKIGRRLLIGS